MYTILRTIVLLVLISICIYIMRKQRRTFKTKALLICFSLLIMAAISVCPIENLVHTFSSPEDAFKYKYSNGDINVVEGANSALVVSENEDGDSTYEVFPKANDGYKLPNINATEQIVNDFFETAYIDIEKCNDDYYVLVIAYDATEISDNKSSEFHYSNQTGTEDDMNLAYAYVEDISDFCITIAGETIKVV